MDPIREVEKKSTVAIVTSALNEELCLPELFERIQKVARVEKGYIFSLIIADNGSTDTTWEIIEKFKQQERIIGLIGIRMSRTFPFDAALTCGLDQCDSDVAIIMTSDLQDPPEEIPQMLRLYEEGYEQVVVRVTSRQSVPLFRRILTRIYYKLANRLTTGVIMDSVSDFRLVSKKVYLAMQELKESHRFIRGIGSWVGFKTISIDVPRPERFGGESKWLKMRIGNVILKSLSSIFAFSNAPLLFISGFGLWASALAFVATCIMAFSWIFFGVPFAGFGTIVGIALLGFSLILLFIGVLAQYVALIHEEVKNRPLYIIQDRVSDSLP